MNFSEISMNASPVTINAPTKPQSGSALAIVFFLLGMPHVYGFLQQRSQRQTSLMRPLPLEGISLLTITVFGALSWLMF